MAFGEEVYAVPVPGTGSEHATPVYRDRDFPKELVEQLPGEDLQNGWDCFLRGAKVGGARPCLGAREQLSDGGRGGYRWQSYNEVKASAEQVGSALLLGGYCRDEVFKEAKGDLVFRALGIHSKNRPEWIISEQACQRTNTVVVPLYDSLGPTAMIHILAQTRLRSVVGSGQCLDAMLRVLDQWKDGTVYDGDDKVDEGDRSPWESCKLQYYISFDQLTDSQRKSAQNAGITIELFSDLLARGTPNDAGVGNLSDMTYRRATRQDVNTICYTSGTTGVPKGVVLTHGALVAVCSASIRGPLGRGDIQITKGEVSLSYLPMAHMYERAFNTVMMAQGGAIGFYSGDPKLLLEDMRILRPTIFCGVPRVFDRIYTNILSRIKEKGVIARSLFDIAIRQKSNRWHKSGECRHWFWDTLLFNQIRNAMGGRIRFMINGAAPIDKEVQRCLSSIFAVPILQGYGLTETSAATMASMPTDSIGGTIGKPFPCVEFKLVDVPDMGYFTSQESSEKAARNDDVPQHDNMTANLGVKGFSPAGELWIRGPAVFTHYFQSPEETMTALDTDGWCHTGDIAIFAKNNSLKIIDRKKNILKLAQGEYVCPEQLEGLYVRRIAVIEQLFVWARSVDANLIGLLVLNPENLTPFLLRNREAIMEISHRLKADSAMASLMDQLGCVTDRVIRLSVAKEISQTQTFKILILRQLDVANRTGPFQRFEAIKNIAILEEPFSVEDGLLTPTLKIKRFAVECRYISELEALQTAGPEPL